eukprot:CAMPEP_0170484224 /NCGR_PEP_ID=MMETSP0208-20121228/3730_1 /TAXON_ID=197538 /ORGANISM="Strombidium inclinatum, Strain S3" /LENGTH=35 /DNA_ID= /DNA_START= /DNA_END= /DNA_ORIENTATION=
MDELGDIDSDDDDPQILVRYNDIGVELDMLKKVTT